MKQVIERVMPSQVGKGLEIDLPEQKDKLTKSTAPRYGQNPFMAGVTINRGKKKIQVGKAGSLADLETGEVHATEISVIREVDRTEFVKLYREGVKRSFELSPSGTKLLTYVLNVVQDHKMTDRITLHFFDYQERFPGDHNKMSKATFFRGFGELLNKGFIAQSNIPNLYYINPDLFFNGDKVRFVTEYRKNSLAKALEESDKIAEMVDETLLQKDTALLEADQAKKEMKAKTRLATRGVKVTETGKKIRTA